LYKILFFGALAALSVFIYQQLELRNSLPVMITRLDNNTIEFHCLKTNKCPSRIKLDNVVQPIVYIESSFYQNPDTIVLVMRRSDETIIVFEINPKNNQTKYTILSQPTIPPLMIVYTDMQVVIGDKTGQLFFIQDGVLSNQVKLKADDNNTSIANLFIKNNKIIALNSNPINHDNKTYTQVWLINLSDTRVSSQLLPIPEFDKLGINEPIQSGAKYAGRLTNISEDLTKLYYFYYLGSTEGLAELTLGMFDVNTFEEKSTSSDHCINLMTGYAQYTGIMYSSKNDLEGNASAVFVNMKNLTPVTDMSKFVQNELTTKLVIEPFYQNFLVGTNSKLFVVTPLGETVKEYALPPQWNNQNYVLVAYQGQ
jgi:hypothetical protein